MMKRTIITLLTVVASGAMAVAQNSSRPLTLEEAVNMTLANNPSLKAMEYEERAAKRERQAAIGLYMPKVNVRGAYAYMGKDIEIDMNHLKPGVQDAATQILGTALQDPSLGQILQPMMPQIQGGLTQLLGLDWAYTLQKQSFGFIGGDVTMPIFTGGKIIAANRAARINEQTVKSQGNQQRNALVSETVERYFGYALARQVVEVRRQVVAGVSRHLEDIRSLEKNGMVASADRLYVEYRLAEAERELQNAMLDVETVASALCNTLGEVQAIEPVSAMFMLDEIESLEHYRSVAANSNPMVEQIDLKRRLAKQNVNLHRAEFFPEIAAMGGMTFYNYQTTKMLPRWAVGVGFNFKIFDGLNREFKYSAARNTLRRVEAMQTKVNQAVPVLVENIYNKAINYRNQFRSITSSIAFAEEYLRAKNAAYLEGMGTTTELIDAELNLAKVRIERMQVVYNFDVCLARLLETIGTGDDFLVYARSANAKPILFDNK